MQSATDALQFCESTSVTKEEHFQKNIAAQAQEKVNFSSE